MMTDYISRLQEGIKKWSKIVRNQIKKQEVEVFKEFKGKIDGAILKEYGANLEDLLEDHKMNLMKRSHIYGRINGKTLNHIGSLLKRILADDHRTLTTKRQLVAELRHQVKRVDAKCF